MPAADGDRKPLIANGLPFPAKNSLDPNDLSRRISTDKPAVQIREFQPRRALTASRVSTSLMVKVIIIKNQNNPAPAKTQVSGGL
jgi:hypothetical protein